MKKYHLVDKSGLVSFFLWILEINYIKIRVVINGMPLHSMWMIGFDISEGFNASVWEVIVTSFISTTSHLRNSSSIIIAIRMHSK